jgi:hypothetical protein
MSTKIGDALALRIAKAEREYSAEGAVDGPRTMSRIRHRRAGALVGTVTAALVGVGLLASLGLTLTNHHEPADDLPSPISLSFVPGQLGVPYSAHAAWSCGEPAPATAPITLEFTLTVDTTPMVIDHSAATVSDYGEIVWPTQADVATLAMKNAGSGAINPGWLFVEDGVVVAYQDEEGPGAYTPPYGVTTWFSDDSFSFGVDSPLVLFCGSDPNRNWYGSLPLPAGEYLAIPIVRIVSSPETDAAFALAAMGASSDPIPVSGAGSWDCRTAIAQDGLVPVTCLESIVIDPVTGKVTIEIPPDQRNPERDVLLVGQPIPYSVTGTPPALAPIGSSPGPDFAVCDTAGPVFQAADFLEVYASPDAIIAGVSTPMEAYVLGQPGADGTESFPDGLDVSVIRYPPTGGLQGVVGRGHATIDGGESFVLDRYAGPTKVSLVLTSLSWCGDRPGPNDPHFVELDGWATWTDGVSVELYEPLSAYVSSVDDLVP